MVTEDDSGIAENMHTDPSIVSSPSINCSVESDIEMQSEKGESCWENFEKHNLEEMCRMATLVEHFGLTSFRPYKKEVIDMTPLSSCQLKW